LLRVLEDRNFGRVGGVKAIGMNERVNSASHRDLGALVEAGKFRLDLYHRLSVFPIMIAPLRARGDDVVLLAEHFIAEYGGKMGKQLTLCAETREILGAYDWPGNVRELKNVIERAVIVASGGELSPELLPEGI